MNILITGGTGFLGRRVVQNLQEQHQLYLISRSYAKQKNYIQLDLTKPLIENSLDKFKSIDFDLIIHMAALYDLKSSKSDVYQNNLLGLQNSLKIAEILKIPFFVNTSSIAAGMNTRDKESFPDKVNLNDPFPDAYSQSKAFGENLIIKNKSIPYKLNLRLGILIGDSVNGEIQRTDGPYIAPNLFLDKKSILNLWPFPLFLPGTKNLHLPLVPVDSAAKAIIDLIHIDRRQLFQNHKDYVSLNLTPRNGLSILDFYESCLKNLRIKQRKIYLTENWPDPLTTFFSKQALQFPEEQLKYILQIPIYNSDKTIELLGHDWCPEFKDFEGQFWMGYEKYISNHRN